MSRGLGPVLHFPHFPTIDTFPLPPGEPFSVPRPRRCSPPETRAVPVGFPFDSTVCDFRRFSAQEDAKCIKITHGGIENPEQGKLFDIVVGVPVVGSVSLIVLGIE